MNRIQNIEVIRAFMCGLAILGTARFLELIGTFTDGDEKKRKRLGVEMLIAFGLLLLIRNLY